MTASPSPSRTRPGGRPSAPRLPRGGVVAAQRGYRMPAGHRRPRAMSVRPLVSCRRSHPLSRIRTASFRPVVEGLEERVVPYALTGYKWANVNVTASFMPDGTLTDSGLPSTLFATLNALAPTATWQHEYARALQTWADATPLNFRIAPANGP